MAGKDTGTLAPPRAGIAERYIAVRELTETLAAPLAPEDQVVQSMPDVSPTKWHRAHTTWFFETFVLGPSDPGYRVHHPGYAYLFNSYYEAAGPRHPRPQRGLLSRPTVAEVGAYRRHVDSAVTGFVENAGGDVWARVAPLVELGLHHEQQHQELLLMDIKHVLSLNPLDLSYGPAPAAASASAPLPMPGPARWVDYQGGLVEIGHDPGRDPAFCFDNEGPRHTVLLQPFRLADRLVTAGEWLDFVADGGYRRPDLWLSDGWYVVQAQRWEAPLYWREDGGDWSVFTLHGRRPLDPAEPVVHVSHYEADAYARWAGARLPTEFEWEHAAAAEPAAGNFLPLTRAAEAPLHPRPANATRSDGQKSPTVAGTPAALRQLYGDVWEWTASAYLPYPRFAPAPGAVGEYNGKFMSNQMVLRGGACVTPDGHLRPTYRNFFPPASRWVFGGVRLAADP